MTHNAPVLTGNHIRLEPLSPAHADGLVAASAGDPALYAWSAVPIGRDAVLRYIQTALAWREAGTALAFATVRIAGGVVIGSTRFFDIARWDWPAGHPRHGHQHPDVCEIGYTWLAHSAIRTAANTEAKLLMLTHAFESGTCSASACTPTRAISARRPLSSASEANSKAFSVPTAWHRTSSLAIRSAIHSSRRNGPKPSAASHSACNPCNAPQFPRHRPLPNVRRLALAYPANRAPKTRLNHPRLRSQ